MSAYEKLFEKAVADSESLEFQNSCYEQCLKIAQAEVDRCLKAGTQSSVPLMWEARRQTAQWILDEIQSLIETGGDA